MREVSVMLLPDMDGSGASEGNWRSASFRNLHRPALVVYGGEDEHDNVPVEASVQVLREALSPNNLPSA